LLTFDKAADYLLVDRQQEITAMTQQMELLQGTLDLLVLKSLAVERMHGWGIAQRIQQVSDNVLQVGQGSLYPALHRLEMRGWISSEWGASESNRRARYYSLTRSGRKQLEKQLQDWNHLCSAIGLVLQES
jgi:PadR family transcriptional regulator PadR